MSSYEDSPNPKFTEPEVVNFDNVFLSELEKDIDTNDRSPGWQPGARCSPVVFIFEADQRERADALAEIMSGLSFITNKKNRFGGVPTVQVCVGPMLDQGAEDPDIYMAFYSFAPGGRDIISKAASQLVSRTNKRLRAAGADVLPDLPEKPFG